MKSEYRVAGRPSLPMAFVLLCAIALFTVRGPLRAMHGAGGDFAAPFVAGLRFLRGVNPYSSDDFEAAWHLAGAGADESQNTSGTRSVYPPSTLLLMAPFSGMRWHWALGAYELLCSVSLGFLLFLLAREVGTGWNSWARIGFVAYALALAPVHAGMGVGNLSVLAFLLGMYCLLLGREHRDTAAGVILALCLCLKPSVGVIVLVYWLVCRRWRVVGWSLGLTAALTGAAMLRMQSIPKVWLTDYRANAAFLFGPSGVANFTDQNGYRFDLLNLQVPFYELTHREIWANGLSWAVVGCLGVIWIWLLLRQPSLFRGWAAPGVLLLLGLLPIYQRNYNAGFVLVAVLWSFQHVRTRLAQAILGCGFILLIPGEALLRRMAGDLPKHIVNGFAMNFLVMPQASWAVLAIAILLLCAMWRASDAGGQEQNYL